MWAFKSDKLSLSRPEPGAFIIDYYVHKLNYNIYFN